MGCWLRWRARWPRRGVNGPARRAVEIADDARQGRRAAPGRRRICPCPEYTAGERARTTRRRRDARAPGPGAGAGRERAAGPAAAAAAADSRRPAAVGNSSRPAAPRDARSPTVRSPTVYSAAEMTMGHTF